MFINALIFENRQGQNKPTNSLDAPIAIGVLNQWSHHSIEASRFVFESAAEHGNRKTCSAAQMVANLSIKQPWHTVYCHLKVSYSD